MDNIEIKTAIVKTDISDHFPIIFATKNKIDAEITEQYIFKRKIPDLSIDKFKQKLRNIDWNNIKILRNVSDAYINLLLRIVVKWSDTLSKSCSICCRIFKVCLTILRYCEVKG